MRPDSGTRSGASGSHQSRNEVTPGCHFGWGGRILLALGTESSHTLLNKSDSLVAPGGEEEGSHGEHSGGISGPDATGSGGGRTGRRGTLRVLSRAHPPRCSPTIAPPTAQPLRLV